MREVAIDTWAFIEMVSGAERAGDVEEVLEEADRAFTVREVVAETFNLIVKETRKTAEGWAWLDHLREGRIRVYEPPLAEVYQFIAESDRRGGLSFTDHALAHIALRERAKEVLTADSEFRRFGLRPLFARK
jgi:predicted nucleic acid-binding protein